MKKSIDTDGSSVLHRQRNKHRVYRKLFSLFAVFLMLGTVSTAPAQVSAKSTPAVSAKGFDVIILSSYRETLKIGQDVILFAASAAGQEVKWRSSSSRIASVDPYGVVTAKKAGTCQITAKTAGAEAKCTILVERTAISLNTKKLSLENGAMFQMTAETSNGSPVTWKVSKKSVALISDSGMIQAIKPGTTIITATADGSRETCTLTVMKPSIRLSREKVTLYPGQTVLLRATVTSNREVTWRSNRTAIATVDEYGTVTAVKKGTARISASLDGVTRYCTVTVKNRDGE
ncbi:MAG: Ig-like domain-containing protein [Eubacterium sp.]|nr:Ig-like domain-containing protein [Eubacterium sp.]